VSRLGAAFGLEPRNEPAFRRLASALSLTTGAELVVEGAVTSAFLARIGASALPMALAVRALAETGVSLGFDRALSGARPRRSMLAVIAFGMLLLVGAGAAVGAEWGVWAAYVAASVVARLKTIHFGVWALDELPGPAAAKSLALVYAAGRLGAFAAGPIVTFGGPRFGPGALLIVAAAGYMAAIPLARGAPESAHGNPRPRAAPFPEPETPTLSARGVRRFAGPGLLAAIMVGAAALALGRLALTTQSGAVLEQHYGEAELARVLGIYFVVSNFVALLLQVFVVGRTLGAGGIAVLNSGWSLVYLVAQALLCLGAPSVGIALGARFAEAELRNAVRTPVANLLYEAIRPERRPFARTLVIGVTVPMASLVGALGLVALGGRPALLGGLGISAAIVLLGATWAQNRFWRESEGPG
jgi:hypothetical protein